MGASVDFKKVREFLSTLNEPEYSYLHKVMSMVNGFKDLTQHYGMSKEELCRRFFITEDQYENYLSGNHDYDLGDMAMLTAVYNEMRMKEITDKPVEFIEVAK